MVSQAFILLGSNQGDRLMNLTAACEGISREVGKIVTRSSIYKTRAWGNTEQPDFYNQVILVDTTQTPQSLLRTLQEIEKTMGRVRTEKWGPRVIDLDILFWNNEVINEENLVVPHPGIPARRFTLVPLQEIAPDFRHPVLVKSISELLEECKDLLAVTPLEP
jgi:2-amino-4-hydroxy-6-hydroxymethyldihydropteridine diphosphokinase